MRTSETYISLFTKSPFELTWKTSSRKRIRKATSIKSILRHKQCKGPKEKFRGWIFRQSAIYFCLNLFKRPGIKKRGFLLHCFELAFGVERIFPPALVCLSDFGDGVHGYFIVEGYGGFFYEEFEYLRCWSIGLGLGCF